jgi:hypothetical protein
MSPARQIVDRAEPCQACPVEKGVTQVITPDEHSPTSDSALRQNKSAQMTKKE